MDFVKNNWIILLLIVVVLVIVVYFSVFNKDNEVLPQNLQANTEEMILPNGLKIIDEIIGGGVEALEGDLVTVNYIGNFTDGTKFDSSYDRGTPFMFRLGAGNVITGWDIGLLGMRVGGKRILTIPPNLAYGESGASQGLIPPDSTLKFKIELLEVQKL